MQKVRVFIGRMSPLHIGHCQTINKAASDSDHLIILLGSSFRSRNLKNPFTYQERRSILNRWIQESTDISSYSIFPIEDHPENSSWIAQVQQIVDHDVKRLGFTDYKVEIVCSSKEEQTSYPYWFKNWKNVVVPAMPNGEEYLSATFIRDVYFSEYPDLSTAFDVLPNESIEFLNEFSKTEVYLNLKEEWKFIQNYKKSWKSAPFPPVFVTTDAVTIQSGHILVIKRRDNPGKGLLALPGGFLDINEKIEDGCIRELREETGLKVPEKVLKGSIKDRKIFDDPNRSERGRTITHAFCFMLDDSVDLPHVKGMDDAEKAFWMPLSEVYENRDKFYEDHYTIISSFVDLKV